ncbi:hypothetical protein ODR07_20195, partial [Escherichia coli]|nr:hypothetical protein [Escherichia coli]
MKINYPLLALAIGAFGIGTTEFSPMGLLPVIARGVDVSIPAAGMLISALYYPSSAEKIGQFSLPAVRMPYRALGSNLLRRF